MILLFIYKIEKKNFTAGMWGEKNPGMEVLFIYLFSKKKKIEAYAWALIF